MKAPAPSCARCRMRKVKCSQEKPACKACLRTSKYKNRGTEETVCYYGSDPEGRCSEDASLDQSHRKIAMNPRTGNKKRGAYKPKNLTKLQPSRSSNLSSTPKKIDSVNETNYNSSSSDSESSTCSSFDASNTTHQFHSVYTPYDTTPSLSVSPPQLKLEPDLLHPLAYPALFPSTSQAFASTSSAASSFASLTYNSTSSSNNSNNNQGDSSSSNSNFSTLDSNSSSSWNLFRKRLGQYFAVPKIELPPTPSVLMEPNDPSKIEREGGLEILLVKEGEIRKIELGGLDDRRD